MIHTTTLAAVALALIAGSATAQTGDAATLPLEQRVDKRQKHQAERIAHGVESGAITQREQTRLAREQRAIGRLENRIESDGSVTRKEARVMEHAQDRASRHIARAAHDRQVRPRAR